MIWYNKNQLLEKWNKRTRKSKITRLQFYFIIRVKNIKLPYQITIKVPRTLTLNFVTYLFTDQKHFVYWLTLWTSPTSPLSSSDIQDVGLSSVSALVCWEAHLALSESWFLCYREVVGQRGAILADRRCGTRNRCLFLSPLPQWGSFSRSYWKEYTGDYYIYLLGQLFWKGHVLHSDLL